MLFWFYNRTRNETQLKIQVAVEVEKDEKKKKEPRFVDQEYLAKPLCSLPTIASSGENPSQERSLHSFKVAVP